MTAAATVLEDLAAVPAVDSVAAADSAAEEDLLDFAAVMVEDGAAQKNLEEHAALEQHGAAEEEVQTIPRPRLEEPWAIWVAPAVATRDQLELPQTRNEFPQFPITCFRISTTIQGYLSPVGLQICH